ncbi:hypothetical protein LQW54_003876 [Pestalotiopsis sp. IQ-011]
MQISYLAIPLFAAVAAAQNSTSLPDLVAQLPTCAADCLSEGASNANCTVTDFSCICENKDSFLSGAATCVITSSCTSEERNNLTSLATDICQDVDDGASSSDLASASAVATSVLATASSEGMAAAATQMAGMGVMGVAAFAAFAL